MLARLRARATALLRATAPGLLARATAAGAALLLGALLAGLPAPSAAQQKKAEKPGQSSAHYEDALARYERKDVSGAIVQLKNALREEPRNLPALVLLGKAQLETGDPVAAEDTLAKALQFGIDRSEVAMPMGQALLDQGKFQALLDRFPAEAVPASQRANLLVLRAHAYRGLGQPKQALAAAEAARAADPGSVAAMLAHADLLARQGRWGDAEKLVDLGLVRAPDDARLLTLRGTLALGRGNAEKALEAYDKALASNPKYFTARMARASLLIDLGRLDVVAPDIAQLAKERPEDPRVNHLRGVYHSRRGETRAALDAWRQAIGFIGAVPRETLTQRAPELVLLGGILHVELQERQKARIYLEDYIRLEPRHAGAKKLLGSVLLAQGDTPSALAVLEEANRLLPGDPETLALMATAYTNRRQYQTAAQFLEQAVKLSGGAPAMQAAMGLGLLRQGRVDLGVEQLERAVAKGPATEQASIALTVAYLKRGQARKAVETAQQLVKRQPKDPIAQNLLGMARGAAGDAKGARVAYERALELEPALIAANLNLARLDAAEGSVDAARRRLVAIVKDRPRDTQAMLELAGIEISTGRLDEASRWLEKIRAVQPNHPTAAVRLVELNLRAKDPDKALAIAKEADAAVPDNPAVLTALGQAFLAVGDQQNAQTTFTRISRLVDPNPFALVEAGALQLAANDARGAAITAEKALAARPDLVAAQALMVEAEVRGGELPKAEQRARAIVTKHPASPLGYRLLADVAMARKAYPQAIEGYRTALSKESSTDGALRLYRAYLLSGAAPKGVEFMRGWVKDRPNDVLAMRALAEGQLATGDLQGARAGYEAVLKLSGEDAVLLNNLANVLAQQGDRGALGYAERAHRLAPTDAEIQDTLGWVLVEQGRLQEGVRHLREARLRNPSNPEIRYHLAAALAKSGRKDEARKELEPVIAAAAPAFSGAAEARRLWKELESR